jgi:hypothetical protein
MKIKKILKLIAKVFNPIYQVVYRTEDGRVEMYTINKPRHRHEFGNVTESLRTAGFRSYCHNRRGVRSFRYDRIVSLTKV